MNRLLLLFSALIISVALNAQWKINADFITEIPSQWTYNAGNPGYSWLESAAGHTGIVKGTTGAETTAQELISPQFQVDAGDSLYFNHYVIVSAAEDFSVEYSLNGGAWTSFHNSDQSLWLEQEYLLTELTGAQAGDNLQIKFVIGNQTANSVYIDYFRAGKTPPSNTPSCTELLSPADNETQLSANTDLVWTSTDDTDEYLLFLGTDNPPTNIHNGISTNLDTTFLPDMILDEGQTYYWQVIPSNSLGDATGCPVHSFTVKDNFFPLNEGFEDPQAELPPKWKVEEGGSNTGMNSWHPAYNENGNGYGGSNGFVSISLNVQNPKDSWLISEPLPFVTGKLYKIEFYYQTFAQGAYEYMEVKFGSEANINAMETQVWNNEYINIPGWQKGTCYIKPNESGYHYLSWHAYSEPAEFNIILDNITITELDQQAGAYTQPYMKTLPTTKVNTDKSFFLNIENQGYGDLNLISATYPSFISGPESFSIQNSETLEFTFSPQEQGIYDDVITLETNGGTLEIPVYGNAAKKAYPINSLLTMTNHFEVINGNDDPYTWLMSYTRSFEGDYSFQVADNLNSDGYNEWLITKPVYVYEGDVFTFFARSKDEFTGPGEIRIMVSSNAGTEVADFEQTLVPQFQLPGPWTGYSFELTDFVGQKIRLAVHSNSSSMWTMAHYFDNLGMPAVENPLNCTAIQQPADGASGTSLSPELVWDAEPDADDYLLSVGTDNPPTNLLDGFSVGNQTSYSLSDLQANQTYYWQVTPVYGNISPDAACDTYSFTTGTVSLNQNPDESISIFSFDSDIYIKNPKGEQIIKVQVFSMTGQLLSEQNINNNLETVRIVAPSISAKLVLVHTASGERIKQIVY